MAARPTNAITEDFTRRRDLFLDASFDDPDGAVASIGRAAQRIGLLAGDRAAAGARPVDLHGCLGQDTDARALCPSSAKLLEVAVEWLFDRGADLAALLWLARHLGGDEFDLGAFVCGLGVRLVEADRAREAAALMRFLVDVDFDFGQLYEESGIAYAFFESREPNPFVWKILHHLDERRRRFPERGFAPVRILELGCGIGNDAMGFLRSPLVSGYVGTDLSAEALARLEHRAMPLVEQRPGLRVETRDGNFLEELETLVAQPGHGIDLVYSYSSLHYFSSRKLDRILHLVRLLLEPERGLLAFAIKGEGSIWDGRGVPLYRPDVWINLDGQSRWFPSRDAITALADRKGFEVRMHELGEHWGYSEPGEKDVFHFVVCAPRR